MIVRIALWSLADSPTTVAELREYIRTEAVDAFTDFPGLLFKAWISDDATERWGAVYVFEHAEAAEQELPSRARELIGKAPEILDVFDLEATVSVASQLDGLGLIFE